MENTQNTDKVVKTVASADPHLQGPPVNLEAVASCQTMSIEELLKDDEQSR